MCRRPIEILLALVLLVAPAQAQDSSPDELVSRYLQRLALDELLGAQLRERLSGARDADRAPIAERLGALYTRQLGSARTDERRALVEQRSRALLEEIPEGDLSQLRLSLAITLYLANERVAERSRVALASEAEIADASVSLRGVRATLLKVALASEREISLQERRERAASETVRDEAAIALAEARRVRSLSRYYAGWAGYYAALLDDDTDGIQDSIRDFGYLLDSTEQRPSIERLPKRLLHYEHVSRAAVGVALCHSMDQNHAEAMRWLNELSAAPEFSADVIDQLRAAAVVILTEASMWGDLNDLVARWRRQTGQNRALSSGEARLLAVVSLESLRSGSLSGADRRAANALAKVALADMAAAGSVEHVIDLASKYEDLPIAGEGFVFQYARGIRLYKEARGRHAATNEDETKPTLDPLLVREYSNAAHAFARAAEADDAPRYPRQFDECRLQLGLSLFYSGEFEQAATQLGKLSESVYESVRDQAEWMRVVSLDIGVERGLDALRSARNAAAEAYLRANPRSPRAGLLVLRLSDAMQVSDERAAEILAGVAADAPHAEAAQRLRRRLLYRIFRKTPAATRADAARAFFSVAYPLIQADERTLFRGEGQSPEGLASGLLVGVRQLLDVTLSTDAIDTTYAEDGIKLLRRAESAGFIDLEAYREELLFRELQVAVRRGSESDIEQRLSQLHGAGGPFAEAADRVLYRRALIEWVAPPRKSEEAEQIVRHGMRIIDASITKGESPAKPSIANVYDMVAEAAAFLFRTDGTTEMRDLALELDQRLIENGVVSASGLRRVARLAEAAGQTERALSAWLELMSGVAEGEVAWYEARYHSIRLMLLIDVARAEAAMQQFRILHPGTIPPPWDQRLKELEAQIQLAPKGGG